MKELNIKENIQELFPMTLRIEVDGEVVLRQKAGSFLMSFVRLLHSFMNGESYGDTLKVIRANRSSGTAVFADSLLKITAVGITAGKLRLTTATHSMTTGDLVYVMGVNGISGGDPNGFHPITVISTTIVELSDLSGLSGTHSEATSAAYYRRGKSETGAERATSVTFGAPQIRVGGSTTANTVTTDALSDPITCSASLTGKKTFATTATSTVDEPSVGATTSTIEITQAFTNSSGSTITVNEIGLWAKYRHIGTIDHRYAMVTRDVLGAPVNVATTKVMTVVYELNTDVPSTSGGILIQFNEILYRQLAQTTRESKDIFNQNIVKGALDGQFFTASSGGGNPLSLTEVSTLSLEAFLVGPRVGTSTDNVVNTNFRLQDSFAADTAVTHGTGSGELYHYGCLISPVSTSGTEISFDFTRFFENVSGGTITINEMGLYTSLMESSSYEYAHCLCRHLVSPAEDVLDTEFLKVVYSLAINV